MRHLHSLLLGAVLVFAGALAALGQGAEVDFGSFSHDSSLPVDVTADRLDINQAERRAVLTGNVVIGQGDLRLTAARVVLHYAAGSDGTRGRITRVEGEGDVVMRTGNEAAEADRAVYTLDDGVIVLTGDVILTQGPNVMSGTRLAIDLDAATGRMEGPVQMTISPENGGGGQ